MCEHPNYMFVSSLSIGVCSLDSCMTQDISIVYPVAMVLYLEKLYLNVFYNYFTLLLFCTSQTQSEMNDIRLIFDTF